MTDLFAWRPLALDTQLLEKARIVLQDFEFSWRDSLIVASAQSSGCEFLLSEDLQDDQVSRA